MRTKYRITESNWDLIGGFPLYFIEYRKWYQRKWHRLKYGLCFIRFENRMEAENLITALKQAKL